MINRLTDITDALDVNISHFDYDELSRRTALNLANGTSTAYTYDLASRLLSLTASSNSKLETLNSKQIQNSKSQNNKLSSSILHLVSIDTQPQVTSSNLTQLQVTSYSYTYDSVGNRLTMTDSLGIHNYGYDDLYRLTSATLPTEAFTYDPVGNRNPASLIYDAANRLLDDGQFTYTYDDNGNLVTKTNKSNPSDIVTYSYNVENQLISIQYPASSIEYRYDGLGRRIEKNVNATITRYVYDSEDILAEYDGSNTLQAKYLHGPGVDEPLRMTRNSQNYFYHVDGLGSITNITDSTGATVKTYQYDAFGNIINQTGTLVNPFTYTGREYDSESGLYYYRARYYDGRIGRFLQEDKETGQLTTPLSLNLYAYVLNNPLIYLDPFGLSPKQNPIDWWMYNSVVPGPFGQPVSEWGSQGPTSWGDPMKYTEEASAGWKWAERGAVGLSAAAALTAGGLGVAEMTGLINTAPQANNIIRIISKLGKWGARLDKPEPGKWIHPHFWRW